MIAPRRLAPLLVLLLGLCLPGGLPGEEPAVAAAPALPPGFAPEPAEARGESALRRFEIVSLGVFPFALWYSGFAFDLGDWVAEGFDPAYLPWPLKPAGAPQPSLELKLARLGGAVLLSLGVGLLDLWLRSAKEGRMRPDAAPGAAPGARESSLEGGNPPPAAQLDSPGG